MLLAVDAGNTNLVFALVDRGTIKARWRIATDPRRTADQYAVWLHQLLELEGYPKNTVEAVIIGTVVPRALHNLEVLATKYFHVEPLVAGQGKAAWPIRFDVDEPDNVGADRALNTMAAHAKYPGDLIVIDFGTATTINVISGNREYLGGTILPGLRIAMEALEKNTARLPTVEIVPPHDIIGRSTIESIQSGLYFGTRAMVIGLTRELRKAAFGAESTVVIGTGGFARLFEREKMFDVLVPDLVLLGLQRALEMNADGSRRWTRQDVESA